MEEFILYIVKTGICLSLFLLIYRLFLRRATFFKFNRIYLLTGIIISFIIPTISYTYDVTIQLQSSYTTINEYTTSYQNIIVSNNKWLIVIGIYTIGVLFILCRNLLVYRNLYNIIKSGEQTQKNKYKIINTNKVQSPFSVFNYIIINMTSLSNTEENLILKHEINHIYQKHWIDLLIGECLLIVQWFNPIAWLYVSSQKENHEFLADRAVLNAGVDTELYLAVLVNQRFQGPVISFSNSFNYKNKFNRLTMMKKRKSSPWKKVFALALVPMLGIFIWTSATPRYIYKIAEEDTNTITSKNTRIEKDSSIIDKNPIIEIKRESIEKDSTSNKFQDLSKAIYIVNGEEVNETFIIGIDPNDIDNISVLKNEAAIKIYGKKGKNGVIIINTKKGGSTNTPSIMTMAADTMIIYNTAKKMRWNDKGTPLSIVDSENQLTENDTTTKIRWGAKGTPLLIIDGENQPIEMLEKIDPSKIEQMEVFKEQEAINKFGEKAKNGVIVITMK